MLWRQTAFAALVVLVSILWPRGQGGVEHRGPLQVAVVRDGFAVLAGHRIHAVDAGGELGGSVAIGELADVRVVGLGTGTSVVWRTGVKLQVARVEADGRLGPREQFGQRVERVCEGTATNEHRFGVAWLESDGTLRFVHGPIAQELSVASARGRTYCAIASAGRQIALVWRDGGRVELNLCGKHCKSRVARVAIDNRPILGVACTDDACAFAQRSATGVDVTWVKHSGKQVWQKPLPDATPDSAVALVGAGDRIAIAYETGGEPAVRAADRSGNLSAIWQGRLPALAWAHGKLLVARTVDGELVTAIR